MTKLKKTFACLLAALLAFAAFGCEKKVAPPSVGKETNGTEEITVVGSEGTDDYTVKAFAQTDEILADNPGMGWVMLEEPTYGGLPSVGYIGNFDEVKNVSLSCAWENFEKQEGVFDWSNLDATIDYWVSVGKKINLRLCTDMFNLGYEYECVPDYVFTEKGCPFVWQTSSNGNRFRAPDTTSEIYCACLKNFLDALANHILHENNGKYRDAVDCVEVRGYGMVGEWHSGWSGYSSVEEHVESLKRILKIWRDAWEDKLLVLSCTYEFENYMWGLNKPQNYRQFLYNSAYDYAMTLDNVTFRRDGIAFALQEYDARMAIDYFTLQNGLPLLGELGEGYHPYKEGDPEYNGVWNLTDAYNEALFRWRVNYMTVTGWVGQDFNVVLDERPEAVRYFMNRMGYRFVPNRMGYSRRVRSGGTFYLDSLWSNEGMGRCPADYALTVKFIDADGRVAFSASDGTFAARSLVNGEPQLYASQFTLPTLADGTYTVRFSLTGDEGDMALAVAGAGKDGYYLGTVEVGATQAAARVRVDGLETGGDFTAFGDGAILKTEPNVDGTKAALSSGDGVFLKGPVLQNGKTYYVAFDCKSERSTLGVADAAAAYYAVDACSADGTAAGYKFLETSGSLSHRTAVVTVPANGTYRLAFAAENGAPRLAVDNITVVEADTVRTAVETVNGEASIEGDVLHVKSRSGGKREQDAVAVSAPIEPYGTYRVTFDAYCVGDTGAGGYYYCNLNVKEGDARRVGAFYMPADYGYRRYSYVFTAPAEGGKLAFGVCNLGSVDIKNVVLTKLSADETRLGDGDYPFTFNTRPDKGIDPDAEGGLIENFETGAFNGSCMYPGDMSCGTLTHDKSEVISGNYSVKSTNLDTQYGLRRFKVYLRTHYYRDTRLSPNTSYRLRFKFRILAEPCDNPFTEGAADGESPAESFFYLMARDGERVDRDVGVAQFSRQKTKIYRKQGYELVKTDESCKVGEVYSLEWEFTTLDSTEYNVNWGIQWYGAIVIDDVWIEKVDTLRGLTEPIVTEGHAYAISQDRLYLRPQEM